MNSIMDATRQLGTSVWLGSTYRLLVCTLVLTSGLWSPGYPQGALAPDHPKVLVSLKVFNDLVQAVGDGRSAPTLRLLPAQSADNTVAALYPSRHELVLGERAYDVCMAQGGDSLDALAFLLGHELAHFYHNHGLVQEFGQRFAELDVGQVLRVFNAVQQEEHETEADYFGGLFGHIAGYSPLDVAPALLESIYTEFGLEDKLEGYPSLPERQAIVGKARKELDQLLPIFEAGHHLLVVRQYDAAFRCFSFISRTFPSREILNNAGVARALQALERDTLSGPSFVFPFELDAQTRLAHHVKANEAVMFGEELRYRRLVEAGEWFERARQKDKKYVTAYINQACIKILTEEPDEALIWAKRALKLAEKSDAALSHAHALIVRGIARYYEDPDDIEAARNDLSQAYVASPDLAALNMAALQEKRGAKADIAQPKLTVADEQISGLAPAEYNEILPRSRMVQFTAGNVEPKLMTIYMYEKPDWLGQIINTGSSTVAVLATRSGYNGTTARGLSVGMGQSRIEDVYGPSVYRVFGPQKTSHVYPAAHLVFYIGFDHHITGWMLYHVDE